MPIRLSISMGENQEWAEALQKTADDLRTQSDTLVQHARELRAESKRLRKLAAEAREKRWAGPQR